MPFTTGTWATRRPSMMSRASLAALDTLPVSVGVRSEVMLSTFDQPVSLSATRFGRNARMPPSNMVRDSNCWQPTTDYRGVTSGFRGSTQMLR